MRRECRQWGHETSPCYTSTRPAQMGLAPFRCLNHRSRVASRRRRTDDALVFRAFAEPVHKCTAHPRNQSYAVPLGCIATPFPPRHASPALPSHLHCSAHSHILAMPDTRVHAPKITSLTTYRAPLPSCTNGPVNSSPPTTEPHSWPSPLQLDLPNAN